MSLRQRLASLRGGAQPAESVTRDEARRDADQVRDLDRARLARRSGGHARSLDEAALALRLGGERTAPGLIELTRDFPVTGVDSESLGSVLTCFGVPADPRGAVFMDTETTGLSGGTGTLPFLVGLARLEGAVLRTTQLFLSGFGGEAALLSRAAQWMDGASTLVTFNGKSFDAPLLATRFRLGRRADPFAPLAHIDLLHPLRASFRDRWPDCRLRTAEERLLDRRRVGDLAGADVPAAWFAWVHAGSPDDLPRILEHNCVDLVSLAELTPVVRECLWDPVRWGARVSPAVRRCRDPADESRLLAYLATRRDELDGEGLAELGRLARRRGHWTLAVDVWRQLAVAGDADALERLAKYHEHVSADLALALESVERLIALQPREEAHQHRRRRLLARLEPLAG